LKKYYNVGIVLLLYYLSVKIFNYIESIHVILKMIRFSRFKNGLFP